MFHIELETPDEFLRTGEGSFLPSKELQISYTPSNKGDHYWSKSFQ
jgi:hypothetical protein